MSKSINKETMLERFWEKYPRIFNCIDKICIKKLIFIKGSYNSYRCIWMLAGIIPIRSITVSVKPYKKEAVKVIQDAAYSK